MGQRVTFTFHYIIYAPASRHTLQSLLLLWCCLQQSLIRRLLLHCISTVYVGGPRNCRRGVLFLKGQRVDGTTGHFHFHYILYMIADDARLTPSRCKKHMAYDDTRLTPHHCKKHTASFARSTGKFPSYSNILKIWGNYPLRGIITQLAARCRNVNMGFQKLESISFDLMYVDK